jgi:hypothetical protein
VVVDVDVDGDGDGDVAVDDPWPWTTQPAYSDAGAPAISLLSLQRLDVYQ